MDCLFVKKRICFCIIFFMFITIGDISAEPRVKFSCSAQIAEAFGKDVLKLLKESTGLEFDLKVVSSDTALNRLENDFSDIAAITTPISYVMQEKGYVAIPFCKDPMVIIVKDDVAIDNIGFRAVNGVFEGHITNWKQLGGNDQLITKIIPCNETGAYKNFQRLFMGLKGIKYDFMTYCSIATIRGVTAVNGSISFISHGAAIKAKGIKILNIDGIAPEDEKYKYHQIFTFVVKGKPKGPEKELINIALSKKGQEVMRAKGMIPILP